MNPEDRPIQFRTVMFLTMLWALGLGLTIHFILLSTTAYNWFAFAAEGL